MTPSPSLGSTNSRSQVSETYPELESFYALGEGPENGDFYETYISTPVVIRT